ncbi:MAG: hypothetical protein M1485_02830 [Chloroflexi bacterium]|nr:hypothetical protein [Chloroflexota bacterium]
MKNTLLILSALLFASACGPTTPNPNQQIQMWCNKPSRPFQPTRPTRLRIFRPCPRWLMAAYNGDLFI